MVEPSLDIYQMSIVDAFAALEKTVAGYNDFINCDQEHFAKTLASFEDLVKRVQAESIFSKNEVLKDIPTEHMKLLLVPCLEADVLYRMMEDRSERVRQAHVYYLEFLKLMKHYDLLEENQVKRLKDHQKKYQEVLRAQKEGKQEDDTQIKDPMAQFMMANNDRDTKIANYKLKKHLEANIDRLKEY